jgi:hypothetical protein
VAADSRLPDVARLPSFLLCIAVCGASGDRVFSVMNCRYCRNERYKSSVKITESEIAVEMNYKNFYTFLLQKNEILEAAKLNKKCALKLQ